MKANELRIGNYYFEKDNILIVKKIEDYPSDECFVNSIPLTDKDIKPIPLTEEWLVSLGFIPTKSNFFGKINYWNKEKDCSIDVETVCVGTKIEKIFRYRIYSDVRTKCIIYVHSLQNLHFALKGEELILKKD